MARHDILTSLEMHIQDDDHHTCATLIGELKNMKVPKKRIRLDMPLTEAAIGLA